MNSITFSEERDVEASYGYCDDYQPHAVKRMFDHENGLLYDMRWDEAGNLGQVSMGKPGEMFERGRFLFWTEDNRMHAAVDDKYFSYYVYDHSGGSCASREQSQACLSYAEMQQSVQSNHLGSASWITDYRGMAVQHIPSVAKSRGTYRKERYEFNPLKLKAKDSLLKDL